MSTKAYTWIGGTMAPIGTKPDNRPNGWQPPVAATKTQPTKSQPSQTVEAYLEKIAADLADQICAAEERGDEALAEALNVAADALDEAIKVATPEAERGFGA
jgi:hypothetical protein